MIVQKLDVGMIYNEVIFRKWNPGAVICKYYTRSLAADLRVISLRPIISPEKVCYERSKGAMDTRNLEAAFSFLKC